MNTKTLFIINRFTQSRNFLLVFALTHAIIAADYQVAYGLVNSNGTIDAANINRAIYLDNIIPLHQ